MPLQPIATPEVLKYVEVEKVLTNLKASVITLTTELNELKALASDASSQKIIGAETLNKAETALAALDALIA